MSMISKSKRITDLPVSSRPREKLLNNGGENVTTAELLAILINTGTIEHNALNIGETILKKFPENKLAQISLTQLKLMPGVGDTKATRILAAVELGHRLFSPLPLNKIYIRSTKDTLHAVREYTNKKQEYLICLYINSRNELIQKEVIGVGTLNALQIEPREVFRPAFTTPCAGLILVHNHPSGDPKPSNADIMFTKRIQEAGKILGIQLLDHLVITTDSYYSFKESEI